jgi:hypothetical protein
MERKSLVMMAPYKEKASKNRAYHRNRYEKHRNRYGFELERVNVTDRAYGNFDTTVFDVRRDFIQLLNDTKGGSLKSKYPRKRIAAIMMIVNELMQRMGDANRTLPQVLGDLEMMRGKLRDEGVFFFV